VGDAVRGAVRLALYLGLTLPLMPVQAALVALRSPLAAALPRAYHRLVLRILGIRLEVAGEPSAARPTLFVSNHSSYLDVEVLGSLLPVSFVAKSEVGGWPLFGWLARLQRTVFVERRRDRAGRGRDDMAARLLAGDSLVLFAEGTSSDGNRVLPFRTALFAVAALEPDGRPLVVQPVSVTAVRLDGMPLGYAGRALYAWYGDMDLAPHLWDAVRAGDLGVRVEFHQPVALGQFGSRKALADHCHRVVADGVSRAVAGRTVRAGVADDPPQEDDGDDGDDVGDDGGEGIRRDARGDAARRGAPAAA